MTKFSKHLKTTFSAETEEIIRDIIVRAEKFKAEAYTILSKYQKPLVVKEPSQLIENIFFKFHRIAGEICKRHENRDTLSLTDEYDVQDLLRGLLRLHFDDVRKEQWTPSYAGKSTRIDILLQNEEIAIETKMTRRGLNEKKLGDELIIDIAHYKKHPFCKTLYCFVYDPEEKITNPRGFEKDLTGKHEGLMTKVFVLPRK